MSDNADSPSTKIGGPSDPGGGGAPYSEPPPRPVELKEETFPKPQMLISVDEDGTIVLKGNVRIEGDLFITGDLESS